MRSKSYARGKALIWRRPSRNSTDILYMYTNLEILFLVALQAVMAFGLLEYIGIQVGQKWNMRRGFPVACYTECLLI